MFDEWYEFMYKGKILTRVGADSINNRDQQQRVGWSWTPNGIIEIKINFLYMKQVANWLRSTKQVSVLVSGPDRQPRRVPVKQIGIVHHKARVHSVRWT